MRRSLVLIIFLSFFCLPSAQAQIDKAYKARVEIKKLKSFVEDDVNIERIVIYGISPTHMDRVADSAASLESNYDYRYEVSKSGVYIYAFSLRHAIGSIDPGKANSVGDVDYGLILYGKNGERAFSMYCSAGGDCQINGILFSGGKDMAKWMSSFFRTGRE